jgi:hypothetical protein
MLQGGILQGKTILGLRTFKLIILINYNNLKL